MARLGSDQRAYVARLAAGGIVGEDIGGLAAQHLLTRAPLPPRLRGGLVRATWDEVRHSAALSMLALVLQAPLDPWTPADHPLVRMLWDQADDAAAFLVLHVELEAVALDVFRLLKRHLSPGGVGRLYASIAADESSHVRLGHFFSVAQKPA